MQMQKQMKSLKEIMAEQQKEKEAAEQRNIVIVEMQKEKQKINKERYECATIRKLEVCDEKKEFTWFKEFNDEYFEIDKVITSLLVSEEKTKTARYLNYKQLKGVQPLKDCFYQLVPVPFVYMKLYYIYSHHYIVGWIEDGLYRLLDFNVTRCSSGGCDGEGASHYVGNTLDEVLGLIYPLKIYKDDKILIQNAFESLPSKKRIIERTKAIKKEMMEYYWHPNRYDKWSFDDEGF